MNAPHPNAETEIDRTIDRALNTIRDAQPRASLNTRILASVERRAAISQPARLQFSPRIALWSATAAAILAIAALTIPHHHTTQKQIAFTQHVDVPSQPATLSLESPRPFAERTPSMDRHPERSSSERGRSTRVVESCADHRAGCASHDDAVVAGDQVNTTDPDAQALADLHAPSHPAPPLPLTAEEKLFLHMLRYNNATQLAELNPDVRAQHDAEEATAFKAFFPDPPPLKQPLGDTE